MSYGRNRRSFRNFLIAPLIQLKMAGIVILMLFLQLLVVLAFYHFSMNELLNILARVSGASDVAMELVHDELMTFVSWMVAGLVAITVVSTVIVIIETHRVLGASYAIRRHIELNLLQFEFKKHLKLRPRDYLKDIQDVVNRLSDKLDKTGYDFKHRAP